MYDCGYFWLCTDPQGSVEWEKSHHKKLSCGNFGTAAGHNKFKSPDELLYELTNNVKNPVKNDDMLRGLQDESKAKRWFENKFNIKITDVGFIIPKFNTDIGGSVDGLIGDDMGIEVKCPRHIPRWIINHQREIEEGKKFPLYYHNHIYHTHYDQMQGYMAITGRRKWIYLIYVEADNQIYMETVLFNEEYWRNELYPKLLAFIERMKNS